MEDKSKKKIAIITRHAVSNYGSVLQSYALQYAFSKIGADSEIIDYIRFDEDYKNIANTLVKKSKKWNKNPLTRLVYKSIQAPEYVKMGKDFCKYRNNLLNITPVCYRTSDDLRSKLPDADIFCTGSDQVWGAIGNDSIDTSYFLDFVPSEKKKIAYAASFGKTGIADKDKSTISTLLNKYDYISVRENSALDLLSQVGIENASQVLDPTLLLNSSEWDNLISNEVNGGYVLLYQLHSNKQMDMYAKAFAEKSGKKLIRLTPLLHRIFKGGKAVYLPDISQFLSYIKNADYIITDSFHGTAFSINYHKQFIDILPTTTKTRNQSILELTGLTDRILDNYNSFDYFIENKIDYNIVDEILETERKNSYDILKQMINN